MKKIVNWKTFFILFVASVISGVLVIPYQIALVPELAELGISLYITAMAQNLVIFSVVTFLGLLLARKVGFTLPVLEGPNKRETLKRILMPSVLSGLLIGAAIYLGDLAFQAVSISIPTEEVRISIWVGFLATFYGGIAEEVLLRLFFMTLLVWLISKAKQTAEGLPTNGGVWAAILLASVIFGMGHLPITAEMVDLTPGIIVRAVVLNSVGAIPFGWLYWKKGLESAIISHFFAGIVLRVIVGI